MTALRKACLYLLLLSSLTVGQLAGLLSPATQQAAAFETFVSFQAGTATSTADGLLGDGLTLRNRFIGAETTTCGASGCDGVSAGELGGSVGIQVSKADGAGTIGFAYMDIDDTYRSGYTYASVQVEYFDKGTGQFVIQYNTPITDSAALATPGRSTLNKAYLSDSRTWKTYTFYLYNTSFANDAEPSQAGNAAFARADFRVVFAGGDGNYRLVFLKATVTRSNADDLRPRLESRTDPLVFQAPDSQTGLYLVPAGAGRVIANSSFGRDAIQVSSDNKAFFDVDNTYLYQGQDLNGTSHAYAALEISYYDRGFGSFYILFDNVSDSVKTLGPILLLNSNTWVTKTIYLTNVYFGNRTVGDYADIRLDFISPSPDPTGYRLVFDRVTLQRLNTDPTDFSQASNVYFQSPGVERGLQLVNTASDLTTPILITDTLGITRTATQVSSGGLGFFNVSDTYVYQGNYKDATIQVTYFDRGRGFFYLKFDSSSPLAASTTEQAAWESINGLGEASPNDIVYLTDSRTWKTHTFTLSNVYFGNRQLLGLADLVVVYPVALANSATANQGYLLAISEVTVTRSANPIDRAGQLEGNFTGFGPAFVWARLAGYPAGTADLGGRNEQGHGLWQNDGVTDGITTASTQGGQQSRQNSPGGYIYFDVNDNYINNGNAYNVYVTIEYFDNGTNTFVLQYDSTESPYKESEPVTRTNTNTWKKYTFYLTDVYFGNRQGGGSDFRVTAAAKDLYVKGVFVLRAPGNYVKPRSQDFSGTSFSRTDRIVVVYYFPVFDGYYPSLWEVSTMGPPGADSNHILTSYSWRNVETLKRDLEDMKAANIDGLLLYYPGNTSDSTFSGVQMMRNLVAAAGQVTDPPKMGLLLDMVWFYSEDVMRDKNTKLDLTSKIGRGLFFKLAEDFFSQLPSNLWLRIGGRPVINLYFQGTDVVSAYDSTVIENLKDRFEASFGLRPYLIADRLWDPQSTRGIYPDEWFSWGAGLAPSAYPGFANENTMAIGPGFDDGTRVRDREGGDFYARGWQRAIGKGNHLVLIDTWNYWVEGAAIAESAEYGRTYITATAQLAQTYKTTSYSNTTTVSVILGATNTSSGLYQDELSTAATTPVPIGGQTGRKASGDNMFFSVHDSFIFKTYYPVDIAVEYYDADSANGGTDWFAIQYDAAGGTYYPPSPILDQTLVDIKAYGNTKTWKTKTFHFTDAYFGNRQDNRNDFVLKSPGGLVVRQVTVTRPAILNLPNKVYIPFAAKGTSGW